MSNVQKLLTVLTHAGVENKLLLNMLSLSLNLKGKLMIIRSMYVVAVCLYQRKSVTKVKLPDKLGNAVWPRLKVY